MGTHQRDLLGNRWVQLAFYSCAAILVSNLQYLWPLFVGDLVAKFQVPVSRVQVVYSLVAVCMNFVAPVAGYFHDRFDVRKIIPAGLVMVGAAWILAGLSSSLLRVYLTYGVLGGLGVGICWIGCNGFVVKVFADCRGLAMGFLTSAYALGPLLSTPFAAKSVAALGFGATFQRFGIISLMGVVVVALGISRCPNPRMRHDSASAVSGHGPSTMLKSAVFWLMFAMMTLVSTCGMMITSNIGVIAKDYHVDGSQPVLLGLCAVPLALMLDRITNGGSRFLFGALSDRLGRENTLGFAFALEAMFVLLWYLQAQNVTLFIVLSGLVFLAWGEIFCIFPALCADTFGEKYATFNCGFLLCSVGVASILGGPVAAFVREHVGGWDPVFYAIIAFESLTALLAVSLLKTMRRRFVARTSQ